MSATNITRRDVEFKSIKGDEDKTKVVFINGQEFGKVARGWLRLGGEQWVYSGECGGNVGGKTLDEVKRTIAYRYNKKNAA